MNSQARKTKRLQADAVALALGGEPQRALEKLAQLELLEPREPDWPRRAAECHRALGDSEAYVEALARAAKAYVAMDLVVKAIAICKMMLAVDPRHPAALAWMSQLHGARGGQAATVPAGSPLLTEKSAQATPDPEMPTALSQPSAARTLVAKKGLVAVARMVARKAPRPPTKSPINVAAAPRLPPATSAPLVVNPLPVSGAAVISPQVNAPPAVISLQVSAPPGVDSLPVMNRLPSSDDLHATEEVQPEESPRPATRAAAADDNLVISLPPISVDADLRLVVPGSRELPGREGAPSGMFRLAIDGERPSVDEPTLEQQARGLLPAIPLFAEMDPHSLEGLVRQSRLMHLRGGEIVFKQDDPPDCLYVVVNGSVAMFDEAANVELYRVGENEFFGEGALIS
ncbi:MAG TPA: cyclic nucleotide-binding domain-containing protein, partial [Polyangiaceae bacterium]|nr:cyclic nucleotide-binding domain-containing protein [Polyangiaceae bacterium]